VPLVPVLVPELLPNPELAPEPVLLLPLEVPLVEQVLLTIVTLLTLRDPRIPELEPLPL